MIYSELKTRIAQATHRNDLDAMAPYFVNDATFKINSRFGMQLVAPTATNDSTNTVLTNSPLLYLYACLQSAFEFTRDTDNAAYYSSLWDIEASQELITANSTATDPYLASNTIPVVKWSN